MESLSSYEAGQVWQRGFGWVYPRDCYVSKEEDLGMNVKQVRDYRDLEVGMFLKSNNGNTRLVLAVEDKLIHTVIVWPRVLPENAVSDWGLDQLRTIADKWSYTFEGEYTPLVDEKEVKILQLEETIEQARKQVEELKRSM